MASEKISSLHILQILQEYSHAEHIMTMGEIQQKAQILYGAKYDRRVIYGCMDTLIQAGYDISLYSENGKGYFLRGRLFDSSEISLLCDAVRAFPFISSQQSEDLVCRLGQLMPVGQRRKYNNLRMHRDGQKTLNKQVFWNIAQLDDAINQKKKVEFVYLQYGTDKCLHPRRQTPYIVSPFGMIYTNEHYYLVCRTQPYTNISFYRIDFIKDLIITNQPSDGSGNGEINIDKAVYAFTGEPEKITIRCDNCIINDVMDKFGTDTVIIPENDEFFTATFTASPMGVKFWLLQYLPYAEVTAPVHLKKEIEETVTMVAEKYKKE